MSEDFVLDNGGIVMYKDVFNCDSRNFGKENAAKSVCDGGVEADERE